MVVCCFLGSLMSQSRDIYPRDMRVNTCTVKPEYHHAVLVGELLWLCLTTGHLQLAMTTEQLSDNFNAYVAMISEHRAPNLGRRHLSLFLIHFLLTCGCMILPSPKSCSMCEDDGLFISLYHMEICCYSGAIYYMDHTWSNECTQWIVAQNCKCHSTFWWWGFEWVFDTQIQLCIM